MPYYMVLHEGELQLVTGYESEVRRHMDMSDEDFTVLRFQADELTPDDDPDFGEGDTDTEEDRAFAARIAADDLLDPQGSGYTPEPPWEPTAWEPTAEQAEQSDTLHHLNDDPDTIYFAGDDHERPDLADIGWPLPADSWFWQTGDRWVATIAGFHDDWWDGSDPADIAARPTNWRRPITSVPTTGTLVYVTRSGQEVSTPANPGFTDMGDRTVSFHLVHEPDDADEDYRWQCRVTMSWTKDADNLPRQENGHGTTPAEAFAMARAIGAAFMFEESVGREAWPPNGIDHEPRVHRP